MSSQKLMLYTFWPIPILVFQEKELENLVAMDMELQKIAAKLHDNHE